MTELDKQLEQLWDDPDSGQAKAAFYDLFLNTDLVVATLEETSRSGCQQPAGFAPMVLEFEGEDYLVLFDSEERMRLWAERDLPSVRVPGHVLAEMAEPGLYWALNVGSDYAKQFVPEEIAWLQQVVRNNRGQGSGQASGCGCSGAK